MTWQSSRGTFLGVRQAKWGPSLTFLVEPMVILQDRVACLGIHSQFSLNELIGDVRELFK